jgi:hypothetical protein
LTGKVWQGQTLQLIRTNAAKAKDRRNVIRTYVDKINIVRENGARTFTQMTFENSVDLSLMQQMFFIKYCFYK